VRVGACATTASGAEARLRPDASQRAQKSRSSDAAKRSSKPPTAANADAGTARLFDAKKRAPTPLPL
jgi:hypothetical protein